MSQRHKEVRSHRSISALLFSLLRRVSGWLDSWIKCRRAQWAARREQPTGQSTLHFEALEPRLLLSADLAAGSLTYNAPNPLLPGDNVSALFEVHRPDNEVLSNPLRIEFYASTDANLDAVDTLVGQVDVAADQLPQGSHLIDVPLDLGNLTEPGQYRLIGIVDAANSIAESDETNNQSLAVAPLDLQFAVGQLPGRSPVPSLDLTDADGTRFTLSIVGPGVARLDTSANGYHLILSDTDASTRVELAGSGGDGRIMLAGITAADPLGSLIAPLASLKGAATFNTIGSLSLAEIATGASVEGNSLGNLSVNEDALGDLRLAGIGASGFVLGPVQVGGAIAGLWSITGRAHSINAESTRADWRANISAPLTQLAIRGNTSGQFAAAALQILQVGGNLQGMTLRIGANLGSDAVLGGTGSAADSFGPGTLARLRVSGDINDSLIVIGLDPRNGSYFDGDDQQLGSPTNRIQELLVGGQLTGTTRIVAPAFPASVRINGAIVSPAGVSQLATTPPDLAAPTLVAGLLDDSGDSASDGLTRDPSILGQASDAGGVTRLLAALDPGATPTLVDLSSALQADGSFVLTAALLDGLAGGTLADGRHSVRLIAEDSAGNASAAADVAFALDLSAPLLSLELDPAFDTGPLGDRQTTATPVDLLVGSEAGARVDLLDALDQVLADSVADTAGNVRFAGLALLLGENSFSARATDSAGNSRLADLTLTRTGADTTAPVVTLQLAKDSGASVNDGVTNDATITGMVSDVSPIASLRAGFGSDPAGFTSVLDTLQSDGSFALEAARLAILNSGALANGEHTLRVIASDRAGNASEISELAFTLDTVAPAAPVIDLTDGSDSGSNNSDNLTNDATPTLSLTGAGGSTLRFFEDSTLIATLAGPGGDVTVDPLADGEHTFSATAEDLAGNLSAASTLHITIDTAPPAAPLLDLATTSDSGVSATDKITNHTTPLLMITAAPDSELSLFRDGALVAEGLLGPVAAFTSNPLVDGRYHFTASARDAAGNVGPAGELHITIDTMAPAVSVQLANDTGTSASDGITSDPTITGVVDEAGVLAGLHAGFGSDPTGFTSIIDALQSDGSFTLDPARLAMINGGALPDGDHKLRLLGSDLAGNTSAISELAFTLDTTAPLLASLGLDPPSDTGVLGDLETSASVATLLGLSEAGIGVNLGGQQTTANASGAFSFVDQPLALGDNAFTIIVRDAAGNSAQSTLTVTRVDPATEDDIVPTLAAGLLIDSGQSSGDGITNDPTITGVATDDKVVTVLRAGFGTDPATFVDLLDSVQADGSFSLDTARLALINGGALPDGSYTLSLRAEDAAGNRATGSVTFVLDTVAPAQPDFDLDAPYDSSPTGDHRTELEVVTLAGLTDAGAAMQLVESGAVAMADAAGQFAFAGVPLAIGDSTYTVLATDSAGNQSAFTRTVTRVPVPGSAVVVSEGDRLVTRVSKAVELGQSEGSRRLRVTIAANFDTSGPAAALEDIFQIYLVDSKDTSHTLLDRGTQGTALFSLAGRKAEYLPGLVSFDGSVVSIDVTSLGQRTEGLLVFQIINSDADNGSQVEVVAIVNELDSEGVASPVFPMTHRVAAAGVALDLSALTASADVQALISNVRLDPATGQYQAELRVRNDGADRGRNIVVVFPALPAGVRLLNPSGADASGNSYLNMRDATQAGGLLHGATSDAVEITFSDPALARFSLQPQVLAGGPNLAPVFDLVGPLTVMPGGRIEVPLLATDPDGDTIRFSLQSDGALPSGMLKANGTLMFKPAPGQEGIYRFKLIATDGSAQAEQDVTLTVAADPLTTTRISGRILATDGTPLEGVPISLSRLTVITDSQGRFTINLPSELLPTEDFSLLIPTGDPQFDPQSTGTQTISFHRARFDTLTGSDAGNPRLHSNLVTSFLDASVVYGFNDARALALRTLSGGLLKTSPGDLLPLNDATNFPDGPLENDVQGAADPMTLFVAGDVRASENVALSALHTVLLREHNRLAAAYAAAAPTLSDEQLYQHARRMVNALIQQITYSEYLPLLLGPTAIAPYAGYQPDANPEAGAFFATAAFRIGHSQMVSQLLRLDASGDPLPGGPLSLREAFSTSAPLIADGIDPILRGLVAQQAQDIDTRIIDELRNMLFGPPGSGGMDLPAMSIQRARDMGLPSYTQARLDFGLAPISSFSDISSDIAVQQALQAAYGSVDRIDAFVGGLAEDHTPGSMVGELFGQAIAREFTRVRDGDRFWFENSQFTAAELAGIRATTLADLIERNTGIVGLPANVLNTGPAPTAPAPAGSAASTVPEELRRIDGTGNNLASPALGSTGQDLLIDAGLHYADGVSAPAGGDRPLARAISNGVMAQSGSLPNTSGATALAVFWGQIVSHDLSLTPTGISDTLKIHGEDAGVAGQAYPFVAEKLNLLLGHAVYEGVDNVIDRPIYLPAIDVASGTAIDPTVDTEVHADLDHDGTPDADAMVTVAANTLVDREGRPFTGVLSITQVPSQLTPAALPANLFPDLVVTIQPAEMIFNTPAPLTLPNRAGYPPGTVMDLWSINPVSGQFDKVGTGTVSADGSKVETITGGIRNSSWHFFAPPPPNPLNPATNNKNEDDGCDRCAKASAYSNSEVELHSGALLETHDLVPYQSLGSAIGLQLTYDSMRADPRPIIHFGFDSTGSFTDSDSRLIVEMTVSRGDFKYEEPGFAGGLYGLGGGERFWNLPASGGAIEAALQVDLGAPASGMYDYTLTSGLRRFSGSDFAGSAAVTTGSFLIVSSINSIFGAGWGLSGLSELVENPDGSVLLINGNSSQLLFKAPAVAGGAYMSPPGEFSTLVKLEDGIFRRTDKEQTVYAYKARQLVSVTDRNGNQTRYVYDARHRLSDIIDPVGLQTRFDYSGETGGGVRVTTITDPAGRATHLEYDTTGNLVRITDPDGTHRTWEYDARHHMTAEIDKRGEREQSLYDSSGRVMGSIHKDGTTQSFAPAQTRSLSSAHSTFEPFAAPPAFAHTTQAESDYTDAKGEVTHTVLDQRGNVVSSSDGEGKLPALERDTRNLVTTSTDARGNQTTYSYDDKGNVLSISDILARGGSGSGAGLFPGELYPTGSATAAAILGDVNGDGTLDIVTAGESSASVLLGNGDGTFAARVDYALAAGTSSLALGDVDGDGDLDIVTASRYYSSSASVLLGNGDGTFAARVDYALAARTSSLALGDVDGDGDLDIVTASRYSYYSSSASVLLGNGDGTFAARVDYALAAGTSSLALGDVDGDGDLDIVTASGYYFSSSSSSSASVLLGNGDGTFAARVDYALAAWTSSLALGDVDGDGDLDIVTASRSSSSSASVLLGNGDGTFAARVDYALAAWTSSLALGDVDGDGDLDIVTASYSSSSSASVLLGNGDGTFAASADYALAAWTGSLALGDVDGDGDLDIVTTSGSSSYFYSSSSASVLLGNGDGTFAARVDYALATSWRSSLALGDVDGDGDLDIVTASYSSSSSASVLLGNGDGTFAARVDYALAARTSSLALGDVDGDGDLDIVTASYSSSSSASVLLGNGDGTFAARVDYALAAWTGSLALGDVDGDGDLDIVTASGYSSSSASVLLGNGDGTFAARVDYALAARTSSLALGDVDGDGDLDIVTASRYSYSAAASVLLGNGDGTFATRADYALAAAGASSLALGDVDGDGDLDIVTASGYYYFSSSSSASVLLGNGDGTFAASADYALAAWTSSLALGDVDGDGGLDIVTASRFFSSSASVLLGNGDGTFATRVGYALAAGTSSLALGDVDGDGDLDIVAAGESSASVLLNQGGGTSSIPHGRGHRDFTYDPVFNQLTSMTDELGRRTLFDIDPGNGDVLSTTRVVGNLDDAHNGETDDLLTTFSYTSHGLIDLLTDPLGRVTDYDYDSLGRLIAVTYAKGTADQASMQYEYDTAGNRSAVIDELGRRTEYRYDALNRLTHVTEADPDGPGGPLASPETDLGYDNNGNLTRVTDARGNVTLNEYDEMNRLTRRTDPDPDGAGPATSPISTFAYDDQGNLTLVTDPLGHVTQNAYDARNRLSSTVDPDGGVIRFRYDSDDNLSAVTDPLGNTTRFFYDQRNRVTQELDPLGNRTRYLYDPVDNLIEVADRNGRSTRYTYDELDRQNMQTWHLAGGAITNTIDYAYDKAGNLLSIEDQISKLAYTYDARNRVKSEDNQGTPNAPHVALAYSYDDVGNVLSVSDSIDGSAAGMTSYQYDALNRMTSVKQTGTGVTDKRTDFAFNPLGQYEAITRYSDLLGTSLVVDTAYAYDALNRLTSITHNNVGGDAVSFFNYEHDAQSRITAITDMDGRTDYIYDDRDQLTGADHADAANADETYLYDANGNRISSSLHGTGYETGPNNQLLSDGVFDYNYDAEGNMVSRTEIATGEVREFDYDQRNRLVRVTDRASADGIITQEVNYVYDALNRRIAKVLDVNGAAVGGESVVYFAYDREDVILDFVDRDGAAAPTVRFVAVRYLHGPGIDGVLAQEIYDSATGLTVELQWLLTDHLRSTRDLIDNTGVVVNHIKYGSYGNALAQSDASASSRYLFTGREFDAEIGIYFYRARYYEAWIGRFLSVDPIGLEGGINAYTYVEGTPLSGIDPLGLAGCYVNYPGYPITIPGTGTKVPLTHAGVLSYDSQGRTRYYEYGRYDSNYGNVRRRTVPDLTMGPDGQPTADSWAKLQQRLNEIGQGTRAKTTCNGSADADKINAFAEQRMNDQNRAPYSWNPLHMNTCTTFASDALGAGFK